jgi:hypothetical protein
MNILDRLAVAWLSRRGAEWEKHCCCSCLYYWDDDDAPDTAPRGLRETLERMP